MAVAPATIVDLNNGAVLITWTGVDDSTNGGDAVDVSNYEHLTVHSNGNYGGGASVAIQGSNDAVAWFALGDSADDTAIALTADTIGASILTSPRYIRPVGDAAGSASTDIDVYVQAQKRGQS